MTKREAERLTRQNDSLRSLGFTSDEADALRRISLTLSKWSEHECNGVIQREGETGDGRPYWYNPDTSRSCGYVADRERGALKRLQNIVSERNDRTLIAAGGDRSDAAVLRHVVTFYIQGDPRGCALYILRPGDVPEREDAGSYYNRGISVY